MRIIGFLYGVISYAAFLASMLYAIGFVGNLPVPKSIDSGATGSFTGALTINAMLLGLFAIQHSVMARPAFKAWWTQAIHPSVERSTYVLLSSLLLGLLFWKWRAMTDVIWSVEATVGRVGLNALFWLGWLIAIGSTFMTNHCDLFGLRQVYLRLRRRECPQLRFKVGALYKFVRNPIMLGYLIAFWATAHMTLGHLVFSVAMTFYIFVGIYFEERDLVDSFGDAFKHYRKAVPMIIPKSAGDTPDRKDASPLYQSGVGGTALSTPAALATSAVSSPDVA